MTVKRSKPISLGTVFEVGVVLVALTVTTGTFNMIGAVAAAVSLIVGRISVCIFLTPFQFSAIRRL
jgi:hypothetical protein